MTAEPLPQGEEKTARVRSMFDAIAPRYDLVNRLITFGLDQRWRRETLAALALPTGSLLLDVACGTGDLSRLAQRRGYRVIGADLSRGMLAANHTGVPLLQTDCSRLPFADATFDGLVCGYALRNFSDLAGALAETARVIRPGGRLALLEVDAPTSTVLRTGYDIWFTKVVPRLGAALSDREAYDYLPRSVAYLPPTPVLRRMLADAGYSAVGIRPLAGGLSQLLYATLAPRHAGPMIEPGLHARTVALDYGPDPLQFDGSPTVLFDRPGLTLVGWGTALLVEASEAASVLAAIPCDDEVQRPGSGVVALGALPFLAPLTGHLIVPRFTMGIARDSDGTTHRWATAVGPGDLSLPETVELFDSVIWQYGSRSDSDSDGVHVTSLTTALTSTGYRDLVARVVATMSAPGAELGKVVLSRSVTVALNGQLPLSAVLRRLRAHEPHCTIFSFPIPDGTFFGASPELLMARHGRRIACQPLAGTIARGETARADADAQGRLAASPKDRAEHRFVVEGISAALRPLCDELTVPAQPSLVAFRSVAHLGTRIEGRLRSTQSAPSAPSVLNLVALVHPTPAVGGTPRDAALATIAAGEPDPRGYWAGPVGWVDATGDGEWMIGIRSARLHTDGRGITLRAGAGIVADSDPVSEAAETDVKLSSVLESLVPGGSSHLR